MHIGNYLCTNHIQEPFNLELIIYFFIYQSPDSGGENSEQGDTNDRQTCGKFLKKSECIFTAEQLLCTPYHQYNAFISTRIIQ